MPDLRPAGPDADVPESERGHRTTLDPTTGQLVNPTVAQTFPLHRHPARSATSLPTTQWQNVRAALGAVDLNRPLADYRLDTATPLSPGNMVNEVAARSDRQRLARDIFARLVIAVRRHGRDRHWDDRYGGT